MINTVCLCGSTRFLDDFVEANIELTRRGFSVLTISFALPKNNDLTHDEEGVKELLDLVHLNKILRSDAVVIVGSGYISRSTSREILWAYMQGKPVICTHEAYDYDHLSRLIITGGSGAAWQNKARSVLGISERDD